MLRAAPPPAPRPKNERPDLIENAHPSAQIRAVLVAHATGDPHRLSVAILVASTVGDCHRSSLARLLSCQAARPGSDPLKG
jgi:hypothetical protein